MNQFMKAKKFAMENYPVGTLVKIISMKGEEHYTGRKGVVRHIDGIGQLHGDWGSLALIPGTDNFVKIG